MDFTRMLWVRHHAQAANGKEKNYDFVNVNCDPKQLTLTAAWVAVLVIVAVQVTVYTHGEAIPATRSTPF